jgi:hypothetical protein
MGFLVESRCRGGTADRPDVTNGDTGSLSPSATLDRQGEQAGRISISASAHRLHKRSPLAAAIARDWDPASEYYGKDDADQQDG